MRLILLLLFPCCLFAQQDSMLMKPGHASSGLRWAVPAGLTGLGVYAALDHSVIDRFGVRNWRMEKYPSFHTQADDVLAFLPAAAVYVMDWSGLKAAHSFGNRTLHLMTAELMMLAIVHPLKGITKVERPDGSNFHSFPSGHTAQAFLAASFLQHEYGSKGIGFTIAGYTIATGVGALRILNNKHWVSDVLAGAGIGMLCGELSYHLIGARKKVPLSVLPYWDKRGPALYARLPF